HRPPPSRCTLCPYTTLFRSPIRVSLLAVATALLTACSSGPSSNIVLIPDATDEISSRDGVFAQQVKWKRTKPDCRGECPTLEVDTLVFARSEEHTSELQSRE